MSTSQSKNNAKTTNKLTEMEYLILQSQSIVDDFASQPQMARHFQVCHGIVILTCVEAAILLSGQAARGIIMRHDKTNRKWSPPCVISMAGAGIGLAAGISRKHMIIFLTDPKALHAFSGEAQLRIGQSFGFAVGDAGQGDDFYLHFSNRGKGATNGFANTEGLYLGGSLDGSVLTAKSFANAKYYGKKVTPQKILFGEVDVPENDIYLKALHNSLDVAMAAMPEPTTQDYKDTIPSPLFLHKRNDERKQQLDA